MQRNLLNSNVEPKMSLQKDHFNFITARSSEDPILLGTIQGAHHLTWVNTRNPPFYLEKRKSPPFYLEKHKEPTSSPPFYLGKTLGAAHYFPWKNTRSPPFYLNTRSSRGAHHFTWKSTRSPPGAHHFSLKNTRSQTFHPLGNILIIEKWQGEIRRVQFLQQSLLYHSVWPRGVCLSLSSEN